MRGVVAAGHPITAQAGADALRAGGNAVDAAVAAVLMSFVTESPLTGPGAGGFMLVHTAGAVVECRGGAGQRGCGRRAGERGEERRQWRGRRDTVREAGGGRAAARAE